MKCYLHFHANPQFSHVLDFPDVFVLNNELFDFSIEEKQFLQILNGVNTTEEGGLQMPLPFKSDHPILPNNGRTILKRSLNTLNHVRGNAQELNEALKFMGNNKEWLHGTSPVSDRPPEDEEAWWLPIFHVHHPKKGKICLFYNSSAHYMELALIQFFSKVQTGITASVASCQDSRKDKWHSWQTLSPCFTTFKLIQSIMITSVSFGSKVMILPSLSLNIMLLSTFLAIVQVQWWPTMD